MFRELLNATEKRQLELLEQISSGDGCTMEELSAVLNYSIRTIRTDIDHFRKNFQDLFTVHLSKENRWFVEGKYPLALLHGKNRIYKENINIQLLLLLLENKNMSLEEHARQLHTSYSSLFRNIKVINEVLKKYELSLTTKPLQMQGEMRQQRFFYGLLFWGVIHSLPKGLTSAYLNEIEQFIEELEGEEALVFSLIDKEKLFYFMALSLLYIENGELQEQFSLPVEAPSFLNEKLERLLSRFPFPIPKSERDLMMFFILQHYSKKPELFKTAGKNILGLYRTFEQYTSRLIEKTGIQLSNQEDFLANITWRAMHKRLYRGGSFLVEPIIKKKMVESLGLKYAQFVDVAVELLQEYPRIQESITHGHHIFVYWMITHWEGFHDEIVRLSSKLEVMIISELGYAHENFLYDVIEHEFPLDLIRYNSKGQQTKAVPDIVLTDTYSMQILSMGIQAGHVLTIDYDRMEQMLEEIAGIVAESKK